MLPYWQCFMKYILILALECHLYHLPTDWNAVLPELEKEAFLPVQNIFSISSQTICVEK